METSMIEAHPVRLPAGRTWKDKILDYEIETADAPTLYLQRWHTWKDKILDYEIETIQLLHPFRLSSLLPWKDKILDYEIETMCFIRITTRFKVAWKDKILDYEIETEIK